MTAVRLFCHLILISLRFDFLGNIDPIKSTSPDVLKNLYCARLSYEVRAWIEMVREINNETQLIVFKGDSFYEIKHEQSDPESEQEKEMEDSDAEKPGKENYKTMGKACNPKNWKKDDYDTYKCRACLIFFGRCVYKYWTRYMDIFEAHGVVLDLEAMRM